MNARERLRAYLEQRRELGESEMTLDALDVDDVLRLVGAVGAAGSATPAAPVGRTAPVEREAPPPQPREPSTEPRDDAAPATPSVPDADWRGMLERLKPGAVRPPAERAPAQPASPAAAADAAPPPSRGAVRLLDGVVFPLGLRVERPSLLPGGGGQQWASLDAVAAAVAECTACPLAQSATNPVPGKGNPEADVLVVGEAPGEREDLTGEPFVGPAGELLTKILAAIQLTRDDVFICNVLKHRPPGNRNPLPDEIRACGPFLQRQVDLVQPRVILALGTFAAQTLLGSKLAIGKLRQQVHWYQGIPLVATYHPAALLRNESWKRPTWEDVKLARRVLDATVRA